MQYRKQLSPFSRDWWLDAACGETKWEVLLTEEKGKY